jgi:hypothetical protein
MPPQSCRLVVGARLICLGYRLEEGLVAICLVEQTEAHVLIRLLLLLLLSGGRLVSGSSSTTGSGATSSRGSSTTRASRGHRSQLLGTGRDQLFLVNVCRIHLMRHGLPH